MRRNPELPCKSRLVWPYSIDYSCRRPPPTRLSPFLTNGAPCRRSASPFRRSPSVAGAFSSDFASFLCLLSATPRIEVRRSTETGRTSKRRKATRERADGQKNSSKADSSRQQSRQYRLSARVHGAIFKGEGGCLLFFRFLRGT